MDILQDLMTLFYYYFRPIIKGFLRLTTRLCELQRICYGEAIGGPRTLGVELALQQSRSKEIQDARLMLDDHYAAKELSESDEKAAVDAAVNIILNAKKIKRELHKQFVISLRGCLRQAWSYQRLVREVEALRETKYDDENLEHERSLLQLWSLLQPGVPLETRKSKQWQNIGFQGQDPKTDFRGMGILGLQNLLYFAKEYNSVAKHILSHSHHPKHGFYTSLQSFTPTVRYSFAIVGINLTQMAYRLLGDGTAKGHLYNVAANGAIACSADVGSSSCRAPPPPNAAAITAKTAANGVPELRHFHHLYSYLFVEFDKFWLAEKPRDIMEFNRIRDLFENNVRSILADSSATLKINVTVENV